MTTQDQHQAIVAAIRRRYEQDVAALAEEGQERLRQGHPQEEVARHLVGRRRTLQLHYKETTPEPERSQAIARSQRLYGDPAGPTVEMLLAGGRTWDDIIASATRPGFHPIGPNSRILGGLSASLACSPTL